jgi:hypothetical protein
MPDAPESLERAVWAMQDDMVEWAARELVDACRQRYRDAEALLGRRTALGLVNAGETTFFIRTVRSIVMLMADSWREQWLPHRDVAHFLGIARDEWHQREWQMFHMVELQDLLNIPDFVRNVLISTLHPDTDIGMAAEYEVLLLLRERHGMPVPVYLSESHVQWAGS